MDAYNRVGVPSITIQQFSQRGFTLVELIAVIVILAIVSSIGMGFVVRSMESYQQTQNRALLVNTARQALERVTRQLRIALPYSVRILNNGNCVEFMPIAAGGNYFSAVPDAANGAPAGNSIPASPATIDFGTPRHVTIGAMQDSEIYGASAVSRATYSSYSSGALVLSAAKQWQRNSISKRYYLLDNPQAFCVASNELRFYSNLGIADNLSSLPATFDIIAKNVTGTTPFSLQNGTENRNVRLNISLKFASGNESITYVQHVLIRNVP